MALLALVSVFVCLGAAPGTARADLRINPTRTYVTNGPVETIVPTASATYIAGRFTGVGPRTGPGGAIDASTAKSMGLPEVAGGSYLGVSAAAPDGSGGFYIGGGFKRVGLASRFNLAHILANGRVDPSFHPNPNGQVGALEVSGQTLFVGGSFTSIGGQARNGIAALDPTTGTVTDWDPSPHGGWGATVRALAVSGQTVYVGGSFSSIGGQARSNVAAVDVTTGQATSWNPDPKTVNVQMPPVFAIAVSGQTVYVGGYFTSIGGQPRHNIAALDATTGGATGWDPNVGTGSHPMSPPVGAIAVSGQTVYVGGLFTSIGAQERNSLAALDATSGEATSWNPDVQGDRYSGGEIRDIAVSGQTVYVGGFFTSIGGQERNSLAALDATSGEATSWNPDVLGGPASRPSVFAIAVSGQTVYAGGAFRSIGGQTRNGLAALDPKTGALTSWDPNPQAADGTGGVAAIAVSGQTVYVGGYFASIDGKRRTGIAAVDATTGKATNWNPAFANSMSGGPSPVYTIVVKGQTIYVGGYFTSINGQPRNGIAALDATTGQPTSWDPDPKQDGSCEIFQVVVSHSTVYASGWFNAIGGQPRNGIAAVDATTGKATEWNPNPRLGSFPGKVSVLAVAGPIIYVGGSFNSIGGQPRNGIATVDATTGDATSWNPNALFGHPPHQGAVDVLAVSASTVYASGRFTNIGGQPRPRIAALDASTGKATGWITHPDAGILALALGPDGSLWAGGSFSSFKGLMGPPQSGIARFVPKP